jgi:putative FmdB family regulatory protein
MPTYEYRCGACGHEFEAFQSMTARPIRKCPSCGKPRARRLLGTGGAFIFKGAGFHSTDYRSASYKEGAKKDKDGAAKESSGAAKEPARSSAPCAGCKVEPKSCPRKKDT